MSWSLGALAVAGASLAAVPRHKDGPPPGHTGGFGEPTCRACHADAGLNEPGGDVAISGVPAAYEPGRTYDLEVVLQRAGMLRAGFQLAARYQGVGMVPGGAQAGVLAPSDERTAIMWDSVTRVAYVGHTAAGTALVRGAARWAVRWTAPAVARGAVAFHVAANAANDDDSPLGDRIYVSAVRVAPAQR